MANRIGFFLTDNWYSLVVPSLGFPGIVSTHDLESVKRAAMRHSVANFSFCQRYEKGEGYITIAAHHTNLCDLFSKRMSLRSVYSSSTLGLENEVKKLEDLPDEDPEGTATPIDTALGQGVIVKHDDSYLLSPEMIYEVIEKQGSANEKSR
jgi:hypothetical protein